ncbi:unnamed protein product [marine sediment metagenome]|uniref:Uncharacterized protein n=1 Tax=marine sediment metagenome TaxID=412755 RepID=X0YBV7_9ZZZZ
MIEFKTRARKDVNCTSDRRIWQSRCGRYRIVESRSHFHELVRQRNGKTVRRRLPTVYYAMRACAINGRIVWDVLSKHHKRETAQAACETAGR